MARRNGAASLNVPTLPYRVGYVSNVRFGIQMVLYSFFFSFVYPSHISIPSDFLLYPDGAKVKRHICNEEGCTNKVIARGKCQRHDRESRKNLEKDVVAAVANDMAAATEYADDRFENEAAFMEEYYYK